MRISGPSGSEKKVTLLV